MIQKISDQWDGVEKDLTRVGNPEGQQLEAVAQKVKDVRRALHTMCQASVTRATLKEAVREAVVSLIEERGDELFPELKDLRGRLADAAAGQGSTAASSADVAGVSESVDELRARLDSIEARAGELGISLDDGLGTLQLDVNEVRSVVDGTGRQVNDEVEVISEMIMDIEEGLVQLKQSIPETAKTVMGELEVRLGKEISEMMEQLTAQIGELKEMLGRVEESVPSRGMVESLGAEVGQRLGRIEETFSKVSGQVEHIDSTTPEIESMGVRFRELREQTAAAQEELVRNSEGVAEIRSTLGGRLDELELALKDVVSRWESDQSAMAERLSRLRDSLRDQLHDFNLQVEGEQKGLWNKLRGNKDPGLKLSAEEFDSLSGRLEGIISGLETVISKKDQS
jgi:chromosome segregation ATPase